MKKNEYPASGCGCSHEWGNIKELVVDRPGQWKQLLIYQQCKNCGMIYKITEL
jgi:hypothetical protein